MTDHVNRPDHYTRYEIEPIEFIMRNDLPFHVGNIVKYAVRAGFKSYADKTPEQSEIIDLMKVQRYAQMRINQLEGETIL